MKSLKKEFVASKDRMLTKYPTLREIKEKGVIKRSSRS
jgi:hypothetical protein